MRHGCQPRLRNIVYNWNIGYCSRQYVEVDLNLEVQLQEQAPHGASGRPGKLVPTYLKYTSEASIHHKHLQFFLSARTPRHHY